MLFTIFHPKTCSIRSPTGNFPCLKARGLWQSTRIQNTHRRLKVPWPRINGQCITSSTPKKGINFTLKVSARVASLVHWIVVCCSTKQFVVSVLIGGSRLKHTVQDKTRRNIESSQEWKPKACYPLTLGNNGSLKWHHDGRPLPWMCRGDRRWSHSKGQRRHLFGNLPLSTNESAGVDVKNLSRMTFQRLFQVRSGRLEDWEHFTVHCASLLPAGDVPLPHPLRLHRSPVASPISISPYHQTDWRAGVFAVA